MELSDDSPLDPKSRGKTTAARLFLGSPNVEFSLNSNMPDAVAQLMADLESEKQDGEIKRPVIPSKKDLFSIEQEAFDWGFHGTTTAVGGEGAGHAASTAAAQMHHHGSFSRRGEPKSLKHSFLGRAVTVTVTSAASTRPERCVSSGALLQSIELQQQHAGLNVGGGSGGPHFAVSSSNNNSIARASSAGQGFRQKGFGIAKRPALNSGDTDCKLGPGSYNTHEIGAMASWLRENQHSHPAQKQLANHKSTPLSAFGKPKTDTSQLGVGGYRPLIMSCSPGPGHYALPDLWDPTWQRYPPCGVSIARTPPAQGESRFGGMARGLTEKGLKGGAVTDSLQMDFIA
mmetsp:Transcript_57836/g.137711  ORF Transcript_57836/g.137711 Transcript_57836/m.137711 type:complete len:344 (-) Transcript_57836:180-1211(-)